MSEEDIIGTAYFQCDVCKEKVNLPIRRNHLTIKVGGLWRVVYQHKDHALMLFLDDSLKVRTQASGSISKAPEPVYVEEGELKVTTLDPRLFESLKYIKGFNIRSGDKRIQGIHRVESGTIVTVKEGDITLEFIPTEMEKLNFLMQELGTISKEIAQLEVFPDAYAIYTAILLLEEDIYTKRKLKPEYLRLLLTALEQKLEFNNYNDYLDFHESLFASQYPSTSSMCERMGKRPHSIRELIEILNYAYVRELIMMIDHLRTLGYLT